MCLRLDCHPYFVSPVSYVGGIDAKEGEWVGACFYSTVEAAKTVTSGMRVIELHCLAKTYS
jgi:hypothetical protein